MNIEIITQAFDNAINKNISLKCNPSDIKQNQRGFQEAADKYNLTFLNPDESGSAFTLYDHKNDVYLDFSNAFMKGNIIDVKNKGEKHINLEDIIKGYDDLPSKVKKKIGLIKYHHLVEGKDISAGTAAFSRFIDSDSKTVGTITMPDYFFTKYNNKDGDNYFNVLAHESMHCYDYKKPTKKTFDLINKYFEGKNMDWHDRYKLFTNYIDATGKDKFTKTYGFYDKAVNDNLKYLKSKGQSTRLNKSSDYGGSKKTEDFAEAGRMVMLGVNNPNNPNATVIHQGRVVNFKQWVKHHPYQTQALAKELYGKKYSINDILKMGD